RPFLIFFFAVIVLCTVAHGVIPSENEPEYSRALLAYRAGDPTSALETLRRLPSVTEVRELIALCLTATGKDDEAADVYTQLLLQTRTRRDAGPYAFALGVLALRQKQPALARERFEQALAGDFNAGASHYFLGTLAYDESRNPDARNEFLLAL